MYITKIISKIYFFLLGRKKLCIQPEEECSVFEEADGTEVDDDECLLAYGEKTLFILGSQWKASSEV